MTANHLLGFIYEPPVRNEEVQTRRRPAVPKKSREEFLLARCDMAGADV